MSVAEAIKPLSHRQARRWLREGHHVIDVGANIGKLSVFYAGLVGTTGRVWSVEPDPDTFNALAQVATLQGNIAPIYAALGATSGDTWLYRDAGDSRRNSRWRANLLKDAEQAACVPMLTLDRVAREAGDALAFIKLDVQGSEVDVLRGATETLKKTGVMWFVEFWPEGLKAAGSSVEQLVSLFTEAGYQPVNEHGTACEDWAPVLEKCGTKKGHGHVDVHLARPEDIGRPY